MKLRISILLSIDENEEEDKGEKMEKGKEKHLVQIYQWWKIFNIAS